MSKRPSSKTKFVDLHGYLLSILPLAALAGLVACGGGGASFRQTSGGGGGGGGGGNGAPCTLPPAITNSPSTTKGVATTGASTFMDLHVGSSDLVGGVSIPFGGLRLWDTGTGWAEINTSLNSYDWTNLDSFVSAAQANNVDVLYNLARTPNWASSQPSDSSCAYANIGGGNGQCAPPTDLSDPENGTDLDWITWVSAVTSRYKGRIKYYEIWNEWNIPLFWIGTPAQLVRMEQDARCVVEGPPAGFFCNSHSSFPQGKGIDTAARIVTPSPVGAHTALDSVSTNLSTFFQTKVGGIPGGTFSDVIGFHGYVGTRAGADCPTPEDVNTVVDDLNGTVQSFGESGKPWFNTEGGWSKASEEGFLDPDRQAAFLSRYFLLQRSLGVDRVYWYRWDATQTFGGALWTPSAGPTEAASAWDEVSKWIEGKTLSSGCTPNTGGKPSVWSCALTNGTWKGLAVWDASQDCQNGTCTTSSFTVPTGGYTQYLDLADSLTSTSSGSTIQIGAKPI